MRIKKCNQKVQGLLRRHVYISCNGEKRSAYWISIDIISNEYFLMNLTFCRPSDAKTLSAFESPVFLHVLVRCGRDLAHWGRLFETPFLRYVSVRYGPLKDNAMHYGFWKCIWSSTRYCYVCYLIIKIYSNSFTYLIHLQKNVAI